MLQTKSFVKYVLFFVAFASMACSERTYNNETLLIEWTDTNAGLIFRVTERPGVMVHTFTRLYVERNGNVESKQIDDDAKFGKLSLVRYQNWLLVLSGEEVWAGYNYDDSKILGEHQYDSLPFTIRKSKGDVVASKWVHWASASPSSFPYRPEPGP
jgi:hypothetical protein